MVTIRLPASLRFAPRLAARSLSVFGPSGARERFATRDISPDSLTITVPTPLTDLNVTISSPGLTVTHGQLKRLQRAATVTPTARIQTVGHVQTTVPTQIMLEPPRIPYCPTSSNYLPITTSNPGVCP